MKLSKNFSLSEFTKSRTAAKRGIANLPGFEEEKALKALCKEVLQPLRDNYGRPITVTSGYRSPLLNYTIGGAKGSQHTKGEAADIDLGSDNAALFEIIREELLFDQLIWEFGDEQNPDWIHVSYKSDETNRKQVLRALRVGGRVRYTTYEA